MVYEKKTPYEGRLKCYGFFCCKHCTRVWTSRHSWANCGQQCRDCNSIVYPFRQVPRDKIKGKKKGKIPHEEKLCQKCQELGFNCTNNPKDKKKRKRRRGRRRRNRNRNDDNSLIVDEIVKILVSTFSNLKC